MTAAQRSKTPCSTSGSPASARATSTVTSAARVGGGVRGAGAATGEPHRLLRRRDHGSRRGRPLLGLLGEQLEDQPLERRRDRRLERRRRLGRGRQVLGEHARGVGGA